MLGKASEVFAVMRHWAAAMSSLALSRVQNAAQSACYRYGVCDGGASGEGQPTPFGGYPGASRPQDLDSRILDGASYRIHMDMGAIRGPSLVWVVGREADADST